MGSRSDVALAIHRDLAALISGEQQKAWFSDCSVKRTEDGHHLYGWLNAKWYIDFYSEISEMYAWLREQERDLYKIVVACHDYPESSEGDLGYWDDNPWGIERVTSVSIAGLEAKND